MANKELGIIDVRERADPLSSPLPCQLKIILYHLFANEWPDLVLEARSARASSQFPQEIIPWVYVSTK